MILPTIFTPARLVFYRAGPSGEGPRESVAAGVGKKAPEPSGEKKGPDIVKKALVFFDKLTRKEELDAVKNFNSVEAARGFVDHYLYTKIPHELQVQFKDDIAKLKRHFEGNLLYGGTNDMVAAREAQVYPRVPDNPEGLRKALEEFIKAYNKMMEDITRKVLIAAHAPRFTKIPKTKIQYSDIQTYEGATRFTSKALDQLPIEYLDNSIYRKISELSQSGTIDERRKILGEFLDAYNRQVDAINGKVSALKDWAKQNQAVLASVTPPARPRRVVITSAPTAPVATDGATAAGESETNTSDVPAVQPVASGEALVPAPAVEVAAAERGVSAQPRKAPKIKRTLSEDPKEISDAEAEAAVAATQILLERKFGERHGIGGKGLEMADLLEAVGLAKDFDLTTIENKKKFVAATVTFQKTTGARPLDGRFGLDTRAAAEKYAEVHKDKPEALRIVAALKLTPTAESAPTVASAAAEPAAAPPPAPAPAEKPKLAVDNTMAQRIQDFYEVRQGSQLEYKTALFGAYPYKLPAGSRVAVIEQGIQSGNNTYSRVLIEDLQKPGQCTEVFIKEGPENLAFLEEIPIAKKKEAIAAWNKELQGRPTAAPFLAKAIERPADLRVLFYYLESLQLKQGDKFNLPIKMPEEKIRYLTVTFMKKGLEGDIPRIYWTLRDGTELSDENIVRLFQNNRKTFAQNLSETPDKAARSYTV